MDVTLEKGGLALATGTQQSTGAFSKFRDSYRRNSNWWTVFACFDVKGMDPTVEGIATRTRLERREVEEALLGLCALGYLQRSGERFATVPGLDFMHFDYAEMNREQIVDHHGLVSQQILNELPTTTKVAFDHRCFAANEEILKDLYADLKAAFDKAFAKAQTTRNTQGNDRIFKMTFTAVDVLSKVNS